MPTPRRILGIDYGSKRIGIAMTDPLCIIAKGIGVIKNSSSTMGEIKFLVEQYDINQVVIGMPYTLKGEKGEKAKEVERFIECLEKELNLNVIRFDERFTSRIAHETMIAMGVKKKRRQNKERIDMTAAALILQEYLESIQP